MVQKKLIQIWSVDVDNSHLNINRNKKQFELLDWKFRLCYKTTGFDIT